jgi:hypothetical protein
MNVSFSLLYSCRAGEDTHHGGFCGCAFHVFSPCFYRGQTHGPLSDFIGQVAELPLQLWGGLQNHPCTRFMKISDIAGQETHGR